MCPLLVPQAAGGGALLAPRIFLRDTFPLTCGLILAEEEVGSSGNSALDNFGGGAFFFELDREADMETDTGVGWARRFDG